jgi:hypothetical protein
VTLTGGFVSQWSDLSGNGLHLTQSTEANRPSTTTVNGLQAVDFDGTNDHLFTSTQANARTVFNVHVLDVASFAQTIYHTQSGSGLTDLRMHLLYSALFAEYRSQSVASGVNQGVSGGARTANQRLTAITFSGTASTGRLDGASLAGTALATGSNQLGIWLGIRNISGTLSLPLNGKICEHIIYDRVLSAGEIGTVERYLASKWGVTLYSPPSYADSDVNTYISAVEMADGGLALESGVRDAINAFITGCKADGIWSAIKASCVLMGARTLAGALVPLVGAAPTNFNFVAGDYNRKTGLVGNGTTKYLDANRTGNADPQDNQHLALYMSALQSTTATVIGAGVSGTTGSSGIAIPTSTNLAIRSRSANVAVATPATGFVGKSRSGSSSFTGRLGGTNYNLSATSQSPHDATFHVFKANGSSVYADGRLAFYSIGEGLTLASLDSRVTALYNAIGAAIP